MKSSSETLPTEYRREDWSSNWLQRRAALTPDALALVYDEKQYSYSMLALRVAATSDALDRIGVSSGDVVAVLLPNGLPIVELAHAAFSRDVTLLLLNTRLAGAELSFQLRDSGARYLLHGDGELSRKAALATVDLPDVEQVEVESIVGLGILSREGLDRRADEGFPSEANPFDLDRPRYILYTSGTTGRPKGVSLSASNFLASASGSAHLLGSAPDDCWLLVLPIFHVGGLSILLRSVLAGSSVCLHDRFDPEHVNRDLDRGRVTGISLVANMLSRVLDDRGRRTAPSRLSCVLLGGGPAPAPLLEAAAKSKFPVAATYGMTEASSQIATRAPGRGPGASLCLLPGMQARIAGEADPDAAVESGVTGEIWIKGPSVMSAYWNHPAADASAFRDGWFRTGDLGALDAAGELQIFDRRSDLIVSGGENVYPAEIETVLLGHPDVVEAGVRGVIDAAFGARPAAWVVTTNPGNVGEESLRDYCRERLAGYKVPVRVYAVESLPRNATGKLLRRELGKDKPELSLDRPD